MEDLVITQGDEMVGAFDFSMIDDSNEPVEEVIAEEEEVEEVESEEVEEEEAEEVEAEEVEEVEVDDEEEVDYENWEIALPNGEEVKLAQLVQGFKDATALEEERSAFTALQADFEAKSKNVGSMMEMALLESQQAVDSYADYDWSKVSKEDPAEYAEHREYYEHHRRRVKEVQRAYTEVKEQEAKVAKDAEVARIQEANTVLARDLAGWGPEMYNSLCQYAVDNGFDKEYVLESVSPAFFKMLHKNMSVEKGVQKVTAKVKKVGAPKKVIKSSVSKPKVSKDVEREAQIKRAMKSGNPADMFQFLVD
ncbi:MAG: hypothetical protein ACRC6V_14445 [Bacteroidales bacterium]